jgi:hypothetical protein
LLQNNRDQYNYSGLQLEEIQDKTLSEREYFRMFNLRKVENKDNGGI